LEGERKEGKWREKRKTIDGGKEREGKCAEGEKRKGRRGGIHKGTKGTGM